MEPGRHPLARFSSAAAPILQYIVSKAAPASSYYRCEEAEISQITSMAEGSTELLAQLEPV